MQSPRFRPSLVILAAISIAALAQGFLAVLWDVESVAHVFPVLVVVIPLCWLIYLIVSMTRRPLRGLEQARLLLDVIENGSAFGQGAETAIVSICKSSERRRQSLGRDFDLLGVHLEIGLRLMEALRRIPRMVPPQVEAMLEVGVKVGDIGKVLPACRKLLAERGTPLAGTLTYLIAMLLVVNPFLMVVITFLSVIIFPKWREIFSELSTSASPPLFVFLDAHWSSLLAIYCGLTCIICIGVRFCFCEPGLLARAVPFLKSFHDWAIYLLPWRRKRLQRDLAAMLAILLDAGVPEAEAVMLAAQSTANTAFIRRARTVASELQEGVKLTDAIRSLDDAGEFRWRLTNAVHAHGGFGTALASWRDALDAKAFQQELASTDVIRTVLVLCNGLIVSLTCVSLFTLLVTIIQEGLLW